MTGPLLIVNADDFGLTSGVCQAILRAGAYGIVTSTSALANGPALTDAAGSLRDSGLGVGAHLALVGHQGPVLAAREVPTLVDQRGHLASGWKPFLSRCALGRVDPGDVRREFTAQVQLLRSNGLTVTHLDTHQNLHLWPSVARVTIDLACTIDVPAIRITRSAGRSPIALGVRHFAARLESRARMANVRFPDATAGFDEAGRLDLDRLRGAVDRLATLGVSSAELVCHPGHSTDHELGALGWGYRGQEELDALVSTEARVTVERAGFRLGTFADLPTTRPVNRETRR
jgi:chitin disaccharide deacetylase